MHICGCPAVSQLPRHRGPHLEPFIATSPSLHSPQFRGSRLKADSFRNVLSMQKPSVERCVSHELQRQGRCAIILRRIESVVSDKRGHLVEFLIGPAAIMAACAPFFNVLIGVSGVSGRRSLYELNPFIPTANSQWSLVPFSLQGSPCPVQPGERGKLERKREREGGKSGEAADSPASHLGSIAGHRVSSRWSS